MFTVKTSGLAAACGFSALVVSTSLAASTAAPILPTHAVFKRPSITAPAPILVHKVNNPAPSSADPLVTVEGLQHLVARRAAHPRPMGPDVECMAKVVYHEAANQALTGQLAVAQVILNRAKAGDIFPRNVCGVVNQDGQFFKTDHYQAPAGDAARWRTAVAIAAIAKEDHPSQVAPGALFYHAAYIQPAWSQKRRKIARIGDQVFYR